MTRLPAGTILGTQRIVWLHDGKYGSGTFDAIIGSRLVGTSSSPILVRAWPGDHVIFSFRPHCGRCKYCTMGRTVLCHGVLTFTKDNHWGFTTETPVMLKVVNGDWKIEP